MKKEEGRMKNQHLNTCALAFFCLLPSAFCLSK